MLWANRLRTPNNISPLTGVGKGIESRESKGHQTVLKNVTDEMYDWALTGRGNRCIEAQVGVWGTSHRWNCIGLMRVQFLPETTIVDVRTDGRPGHEIIGPSLWETNNVIPSKIRMDVGTDRRPGHGIKGPSRWGSNLNVIDIPRKGARLSIFDVFTK
jgi:hypothetical protein